MRVSILTNGPGELWDWARPVATELRLRGHSVSLWLLPCPFASGREREAASLLGVDKLEGPSGVARTWRELGAERTDRVLQLGGDLMFGTRLARSAKAPLFVYTYGAKKGLGRAQAVFTACPAMASGISGKPGARPIGDLVRDALEMDAHSPSAASWNWPEEPDSPRLLLLPGSRPAIRRAARDWLTAVVAALRSEFPRLRVRTLFSPFMLDSELEAWCDAGLEPVRVGAGVAMRGADYALTQPGTNTLEMMHCGLPGLTAAPHAFLEHIPVAGLRGFATSLPFVGIRIRRAAVGRVLARHNGFISLPNRIANRSIVDELYGDVTPQTLALRIASALRDPEGLAETRAALLELSGEGGAAARLCDALEAQGRRVPR